MMEELRVPYISISMIRTEFIECSTLLISFRDRFVLPPTKDYSH